MNLRTPPRFLLILFIPFLFAEAPAFAICENSTQIDRAFAAFQVSSQWGNACQELNRANAEALKKLKANLDRSNGRMSVGGDNQTNLIGASARMDAQGSAVESQRAKALDEAFQSFARVENGANRMKQQLGVDSIKAAGNASEMDRKKIRDLTSAAQSEFDRVAGEANSGAREAKRGFDESRANASQFGAQSLEDQRAAQRMRSGAPADTGNSVSPNTLVAVGGAGLIVAGGIGGLYWVSQRAISKASSSVNQDAAAISLMANASIDHAQNAANNVVNNAATQATNIIQLAIGSANQVIANAAGAATQIYNMAKADVVGLINTLSSQLVSEFKLLSTAGLQELSKEFKSILDGLIAQAKAAGDTTLANNLQQVEATILAQINQEIANRGLSSSTATSTVINTGTGTATGTDTSISTVTNTGTATSTSTSSNTSLRMKANKASAGH
jgi:hypothetical protein